VPEAAQPHFFISYTSADRVWAEWIAWQLEEAGYQVKIQAWDFSPGGNFVLEMQKATVECERTIAVFSPNYFLSELYIQGPVSVLDRQQLTEPLENSARVKGYRTKLVGAVYVLGPLHLRGSGKN
jgi:TIR domain